jgi:hypothetical protein
MHINDPVRMITLQEQGAQFHRPIKHLRRIAIASIPQCRGSNGRIPTALATPTKKLRMEQSPECPINLQDGQPRPSGSAGGVQSKTRPIIHAKHGLWQDWQAPVLIVWDHVTPDFPQIAKVNTICDINYLDQ